MGLVTGGLWSLGAAPFTYLYDHWAGLITASLSMAVVQGLGCYIASYQGEKLLALGGNTGNFIYDVGVFSRHTYLKLTSGMNSSSSGEN
jgi:delta14-sterol reductase